MEKYIHSKIMIAKNCRLYY